MDSKKSPLALLAQTCSQIGSDPVAAAGSSSNSSSKITERKKSTDSSPIQQQQNNNNKASPILSVGGSMDLSNKGRSSSASVEDPASSSSSKTMKKESRQKETAESRRSKSSSPKDRPRPSLTGSELPPTTLPTAATPSAAASSIPAYNPLMMPTSDPMAGYKSLMAAGISPYPSPYYPGYPSGLDLNAYASALKAMPPPPPSAYHPHHHHHPAAAAAAYSAALALQYSRMNAAAAAAAGLNNKPTSSGSEPCRDPYCTGCPNSSPSIHMICPAGCSPLTQCDHPKVPIPASAASASPAPQNSKPYVCNWIVADNYCGKRFGSSDDLLQHLRTHTNLTSSTSSVDPNHPRAYPTPPLSPLSAARYHPYGKHPSNGVAPPPPAAAASFFPQGGYNPALFQHPALAPYYSHLSLFAPPPRASLPP